MAYWLIRTSLYLSKKQVLLISIFFILTDVFAWGFHAHRIINEQAIYCLPPEMFEFFKANTDYLRIHSVDPDKRRYGVKDEGPRHYIDLDHYFLKDSIPSDLNAMYGLIPKFYKNATSKYSEDSLLKFGILPWHLNTMMLRLNAAFKEGNNKKILKLCAEIGHYAGDAHVPLHTTENYNGQLTDQYGIHGLWESRVPEKYSKQFVFLNGKAKYIEDVQQSAWEVIYESHSKVDFVLDSEKKQRDSFQNDKMYRPSTAGRGVKAQFSAAYVDEYYKSNGDLIESKMKKAALYAASLWYTAWVNSGQPDLKMENH